MNSVSDDEANKKTYLEIRNVHTILQRENRREACLILNLCRYILYFIFIYFLLGGGEEGMHLTTIWKPFFGNLKLLFGHFVRQIIHFL